jgi:hypothetical protein
MIIDALHDWAGQTERPWKHDRAKTVGASEIGQCLRRIWYGKHGVRRDTDVPAPWGYMRRGAVYEDHWFVPALRAYYGKRLRFAGDQQRTFFDDTSPLSATPDGLLRNLTDTERGEWDAHDGDSVLIECKSIGSFKAAELPKPEHEFQTQAQMGLVRLHGRYQPGAAVIVYTSAFDWGRVSEHVIPFSPPVFERARERARIALASACPPAEGQASGGRECRYCPWAKTCGVSELAPEGARTAAA